MIFGSFSLNSLGCNLSQMKGLLQPFLCLYDEIVFLVLERKHMMGVMEW